jgi:hypothetical protein
MATTTDGDYYGSLSSLKVAAGLNSDPHGQFNQAPFVRLCNEKCDRNTSAECFGIRPSRILIQLILEILAERQ